MLLEYQAQIHNAPPTVRPILHDINIINGSYFYSFAKLVLVNVVNNQVAVAHEKAVQASMMQRLLSSYEIMSVCCSNKKKR